MLLTSYVLQNTTQRIYFLNIKYIYTHTHIHTETVKCGHFLFIACNSFFFIFDKIC
jgi:hypothetical protein